MIAVFDPIQQPVSRDLRRQRNSRSTQLHSPISPMAQSGSIVELPARRGRVSGVKD